MMKVDAVKRGTWDRQIPIAVRSAWRGAMECNGNGLCFNFDVKSPMCPSMKVSNHRIHSPKGRATLVREWLRLLADRGIDPNQLEKDLPEKRASLRTLVARTRNSWHARKGNMTSPMRSKRRCPAVWPVKRALPNARLKSMCRNSARASCSFTTAAICGRFAIIWWQRWNPMRR
jgi:Fe-S oxidoreductase